MFVDKTGLKTNIAGFEAGPPAASGWSTRFPAITGRPTRWCMPSVSRAAMVLDGPVDALIQERDDRRQTTVSPFEIPAPTS